jgi:hypothetical protein
VRPRWLLLTTIAIGACSHASDPTTDAQRYVDDASYRRGVLEASLVNTANDYSRLRLAHYAGGDARWDALPEWNPRVDPVRARELDDGTAARVAMTGDATAFVTDGVAIDDDAAMRALGERAFFFYPSQLATYAATALASRDTAARYGLWIDDTRGVNALVRAEMADGSAALSLTCASCHARRDGEAIAVGVGNETLDLGRLLTESGGIAVAWGRGRVDVTTTDGSAPVRIPDLRPTRWLTHLHHDATVRYRDRAMLAVRIETLIITSHGEALRPPRVIAWALATYLESLGDALPRDRADDRRRNARTRALRGAVQHMSCAAGSHGRAGFACRRRYRSGDWSLDRSRNRHVSRSVASRRRLAPTLAA